jgi:hypothetical protein
VPKCTVTRCCCSCLPRGGWSSLQRRCPAPSCRPRTTALPRW